MPFHIALATLGLGALLAAPALAAEPQEAITPAVSPSAAAASTRALVHAKSAPIRAEPNNRAHPVHIVLAAKLLVLAI